MEFAVVKNALGSLEKLLSTARGALWDVEREEFGNWDYPEGETPPPGYVRPRGAMASILQETHDVLLVVLEAAEMPETRASLINEWSKFIDGDGLQHTNDDHEDQSCHSPALTYLEHVLSGLWMSVSEAITSEEAWTLSRLEAMLRDTAGLVHRRGIKPQAEIDVQRVMHDYLRACFLDFRHNPPIGGTLKTFKPDCGIASVGAAVEFKFVRSATDVSITFSGVVEDSAGYKGSKDWTRFYAVFYQAEPFMLESHLRSDLKRIGAATWTAFAVNGPTETTKKPPRKRKNATQGSA